MDNAPQPGPDHTPRVLVTGFVPFGGSDDNPSCRVVRQLEEAPPAGVALATGVLPVSWSAARETLAGLVDAHRPGLILLLGQSNGRRAVSVERFALNFGEGRIADNDGMVRPPEPLESAADAPAACAATIDVDGCVAAARAAGVACVGSHNAGAFLCNAVLFWALRLAAGGAPRAGVVHLPMLPGQSLGDASLPDRAASDEPRLPLDRSERAVRAMLAHEARRPGR